jgi:DNA-binding MarR family transcriptional regulator
MVSVLTHMSSTVSNNAPIDLRDPVDRDHTLRIGLAWIELRRGTATSALRDYLFGLHEPLEQGQMDALDLLIRRDRTMSTLAGRLRVNRSTATRAVDRLMTDGLVERFASPDDGRVVLVRITAEGRRRHSEVDARRSLALKAILGEFAPDERAELADLLDRLVASIDRVAVALDDTTTRA